MTQNEFTTMSFEIFRGASKLLPTPIVAELKHRKTAVPEHPTRRNSLVFSIWGTHPNGFWNPSFGTYTIVHDPDKDMDEHALFQVRFIFFLNRKETGSGVFSPKVRALVCALPTTKGFRHHFYRDVLVVANKVYNPAEPYSKWITLAVDDLTWLIFETYPKFRSF